MYWSVMSETSMLAISRFCFCIKYKRRSNGPWKESKNILRELGGIYRSSGRSDMFWPCNFRGNACCSALLMSFNISTAVLANYSLIAPKSTKCSDFFLITTLHIGFPWISNRISSTLIEISIGYFYSQWRLSSFVLIEVN